MYSPLLAQRRPQQLDRELRSVNLEPGAKSWLIQNIDPFHDAQFMVSAPPTPSMVDSVVQCRRIRATLQADASGTLSIFVPPWPYGTLLTRASIGDLADNCDYGGIMYSTNNE